MHIIVLAVVIAAVAKTTAQAQPYYVKTYKHPDNGLTSRDIEYHAGEDIYWVVGTGFFCELEESSHLIRLDSRGSIGYTIDYCSHDATGGSTILDGDTLLVGFNNAPIKSHFNLLLVNALSTDSLTSIRLPIEPQYSRQLIQDCNKMNGKHYIAGRGYIDSLGMIPLFYVLNDDLSVDTMITVDTVFDGRISDMAMTEDSVLLVMYDPKEEQVFSSPAYKMVVGYDREYQEVVRYRSEEEYNLANTTFEYVGDGGIVYYSEEAGGSSVPYFKRVNIYTGEIRWRRIYQRRAFIPDGIGEWRITASNCRILQDGHLLVMGSYFDSFDPTAVDTRSPYFVKLDINTGNILWERVIRKDRETTDRPEDHWIGGIVDAIQHDNGDLALVGAIGSPTGNEMLFLRTDSDGCITPDCGKYIDLDELTVSSEEVEVAQQVGIRVYPNPASDRITISGSAPISRVSLIALDGKSINLGLGAQGTKEPTVGLPHQLPSGLYVVRVVTLDGATYNEKLIIQR